MYSKGKCKLHLTFTLVNLLLILNVLSLSIRVADSESGSGEDGDGYSGDGISFDDSEVPKVVAGSDPSYPEVGSEEQDNDLFLAPGLQPVGAGGYGRGSVTEVIYKDGTKDVALPDDASFDDPDFENQVTGKPTRRTTLKTTTEEEEEAAGETTSDKDTSEEEDASSENIGGIGIVKGSIYIGVGLIIAICAICGIWRCVSIQKRRHHLRHRSILIQSGGQKSNSFRFSTPKKPESVYEEKVPDPDVTIRLNSGPEPAESYHEDKYSLPSPVYQETTAPIEIETHYGFPAIHARTDLTNVLRNGLNHSQRDQDEEFGSRTYGEIDSFMDTLGPRYR